MEALISRQEIRPRYGFGFDTSFFKSVSQKNAPMFFEAVNSSSVLNLLGIVPELSKEAKSAIAKIEEFLALQKDWDSYGASVISRIAADMARRFITRCDSDGLSVYFVSPGRDGEVMVEFQSSKNKSAEIYFTDDGTSELIIFDSDSNSVAEGSIEDNYSELLSYMND